jgi:hypothetical protein
MFDPSGRTYRRASWHNALSSFGKAILALVILATLSMGVI